VVRILLVDDHQLLIDGLRAILERRPHFEIVGVAKDGYQAAELSRQLDPDVVIMDISMPKLNGIDASARILRDQPHIKIIILSMHADQHFVQESLRVGVRGYILKESAASEVIEAVHSVGRGELFFSKSIRMQVMEDYIRSIREEPCSETSPLSAREREVLQILAEGNSTKEISSILNVSVKTVESHRKQIMNKLGLHSIAELTKYAIRHGLTSLE
jgi:DNA-binding NarL/FixJ family response regulator